MAWASTSCWAWTAARAVSRSVNCWTLWITPPVTASTSTRGRKVLEAARSRSR